MTSRLPLGHRNRCRFVGGIVLPEIPVCGIARRFQIATESIAHLILSFLRMDISPGHFARLFRSEIGVTPTSWVETVRVAAARKLLEAGHEAPKQVAVECFADADTLRRAFVRHVGVTPAEYRKRFGRIAA
jgi:transcriptional regulator GlxA family with amidase domain